MVFYNSGSVRFESAGVEREIPLHFCLCLSSGLKSDTDRLQLEISKVAILNLVGAQYNAHPSLILT